MTFVTTVYLRIFKGFGLKNKCDDISIFAYLDYRKFISDFVRMKKVKQASFSYRQIARAIGMKSPDYLKMIVDSKKNLTAKYSLRLSNYFGLAADEAKYFKLLVSWNQTDDIVEKDEIWIELNRLLNKQKVHILSGKQAKLLKKWHYIVVYDCLKKFANGVKREDFANGLSFLSKHKVNEAIDLLKEIDLITLDEQELITRKRGEVFFDSQVPMELIQQFHRQVIPLGLDALLNNKLESREISSTVLMLSKEQVKELKNEIKEFQKNIMNRYEQSNGDSKAHFLNLQFFSLEKDI